MLGDRRKSQRHTINRVAKFETNSGALPRECMITDISVSGARLFVGDNEVPDKFYLTISGAKVAREECRVVWRHLGEIGVEFVIDQTSAKGAIPMNNLRSEPKKALHGVP
jgi:hypothetical protein